MLVFLSIPVGMLLIVVVFDDVFSTLFDPTGRGRISQRIASALWAWLSRHGQLLTIAGPVIVLSVVFSWITLAAIGWALVYLPFMPDGFVYDDAIPPDSRTGPVAALYLSIVTIATLGFGDITPTNDLLRI